MTDPLSTAVPEAVALLRRLGSSRTGSEVAAEQVRRWADDHPDLEVSLLADRPPSSQEVEHDLVVRVPGEGVLGITWRPDQMIPWLVRYADHWASNLVVTVNGHSTTVQQVLVMLQLSAAADADLLTRIVDQQLLTQAADGAPEVDSDTVQAAADAIRRRLGLESAAATRAWLNRLRLADTQFEAIARSMVQVERFIDGIAPPEELERRFSADSPAFDTIHVAVASAEDVETARMLAVAGRSEGLAAAVRRLLPRSVELRIGAWFAFELPIELASAGPGEIVGPLEGDGRCRVGEVLTRSPAMLDSRTREVVRQLIRDEWLAQKRAVSEIEWHWM